MECPKCHFDHPLQTSECLRCGIVFSKYLSYVASEAATVPACGMPSLGLTPGSSTGLTTGLTTGVTVIEPPMSDQERRALWQKANHELIYRGFALPAALLVGWLTVQTMPMLADMLRMWTHETGHAVTAWLCGYPALPTAWITIHSSERVVGASILLAAALAYGGYVAWRLERWFWVAARQLRFFCCCPATCAAISRQTASSPSEAMPGPSWFRPF